jgi:type I restriction enzyme S subunit
VSWASTRVRYVAELNPAAPNWVTSRPDLEPSFLPMEAIGENASLRLDQTRLVEAVRNGYSFFQDGDVAFAKVTPCFENGKAAVMAGLAEGAGFGTTELTVARANSRIINRFLFYVLTEDRFKQLGKSAMTGAGGLKRVPDLFTKDFAFPLPSLAEQRRIVAFLDRETAQIDNLVGKQEPSGSWDGPASK